MVSQKLLRRAATFGVAAIIIPSALTFATAETSGALDIDTTVTAEDPLGAGLASAIFTLTVTSSPVAPTVRRAT
jgi:hypothetical protein